MFTPFAQWKIYIKLWLLERALRSLEEQASKSLLANELPPSLPPASPNHPHRPSQRLPRGGSKEVDSSAQDE